MCKEKSEEPKDHLSMAKNHMIEAMRNSGRLPNEDMLGPNLFSILEYDKLLEALYYENFIEMRRILNGILKMRGEL